MSCVCLQTSSFFCSSSKLTQKRQSIQRANVFGHVEQEYENEKTRKRNIHKLLHRSVTLVVASSALHHAPAHAKTSQKKRLNESYFMTPEERKAWSENLPIVQDHVRYTDLLDLRKEGKVKRIVKHPLAQLKTRPEYVFLILNDDRVVRTVLPSMSKDVKFWWSWDDLDIDSLCANAYSPQVKIKPLPQVEVPDFQAPAPEVEILDLLEPFLVIFEKLKHLLSKLLLLQSTLFSELERRIKKAQTKPRAEIQQRQSQVKPRAELQQGQSQVKRRADLQQRQRERRAQLQKFRREQEMLLEAVKPQKHLHVKTSKEKKKKKKSKPVINKEMKDWIKESRMFRQFTAYINNLEYRYKLVEENDAKLFYIGVAIFAAFYWRVAFVYRKQSKDYDDRQKILQAERGYWKVESTPDDSGQTSYLEKVAHRFLRTHAEEVGPQSFTEVAGRSVDVKFSDIAGIGKLRLELEEIVKFFKNRDFYLRRGIKIPGGILLSGPPGVGKTLLAKAVAGEAGATFFPVSASQFVEIYVGVGAARVRSLYADAKRNAPAVIFIDELDAVGRERGVVKGSGAKERDATLNQLLVCLDGFEGRGNVITLAATNRPDILDPALVRPGRFDRKIFIPPPGLLGRAEILQVHGRKKPLAKDVDFMALARITDGMVGAELANVLDIAAINMMRDGRSEITADDLLQAAQTQDRGLLDKKERSMEMWRQMALREAAMVVASMNFPDLRNIEFVTIAPRSGSELGYMRMNHTKPHAGMLSRQTLLDYITVQLAPRAADELSHGEDQLSTISAESTDRARVSARIFVLSGFSERNFGLSKFWASNLVEEIDLEALRILELCYERAKKILHQNEKFVDGMVQELVKKKHLTRKEIFRLADDTGCLEPIPPNLIEIRAKSAKLMIGKEAERTLDLT